MTRFNRAKWCGMALVFAAIAYGQPVLTWHNDSARTGQNLQETILTPANVKSATFGRLATINVDGKVDAQPLYVPGLTIPGMGTHNVLYVATEHDSLYAFDADTFAQLLHVSLVGSGETSSDDRGCSQVTPEIGITATPAIDMNAGPHGTIYVIAMSKTSVPVYHQRLHALDLTTLGEQFNGPVEITASFPGDGAENTFVSDQHKERPGLLVLNGVIYTTWGSHCDAGAYAGWVLSYNETTLAQVSVLNLEPNGNDGGIWAAGSGPAADANGNLYLLTGNGTFDTALNPTSKFPSLNDFGNAFVKIATSGALTVTDYFTMTNTVSESGSDTDLGSGGLLLLPPLNNSQQQPVSLAVGAGKDKNIYVVNQSNMGKFNPNMDSIYQLLSNALPNGTWSSPAWFNGTLYYGGVSDSLKAFTFSGGQFSLTSHSSNTFAFPGTTPSISANGTSNGIVWAADNQSPAILHAYDATNVATELYNSNQAANGRDQFGSGNKFIVPTIANGKVYVGTTSGVGVFGLLTLTPTASLSIAKSHAGNFAQGQQGVTYTVVVSNATGAGPTSGTVTVTETIPSGLTLAGVSGSGWSCVNNSCTRTNVLAAASSYPAINVTVNVSNTAPSSVINMVTVSGGGDTGTTNKTASDVTTINPLIFTLTIDVNPEGGGTITPASGATFAQGTVVNLQAIPNSGYSFTNWTGSVANANSASTTTTMTASHTVTASFSPGPTTLGGEIASKSGPSNARQWVLSITNDGPGAADNVLINSFALKQVAGPACTPVVGGPGSFPINLGNLAPDLSTLVTITTNFTSCVAGARFTLEVALSANNGAATGTIARFNQFQ